MKKIFWWVKLGCIYLGYFSLYHFMVHIPFKKKVSPFDTAHNDLINDIARILPTLGTTHNCHTNCHSPTNKPKRFKTSFVGLVLLSVKKNHHHHHVITFKAVLVNQ
jgi:hypothetical protein